MGASVVRFFRVAPGRGLDAALTRPCGSPCTYTLHVYDIFTGLTRRRSVADLRATPSFHRLLSRPVALGNPLGTPWALLGDPLGTLGDPLGIPGGPLRDPWGPLERLWDHLGTTWGPSGTSWGALGTPWRSLGDHLPVLLDALGASWGFFGDNLELQGALIGSQRGVQEARWGALGSILEASKEFTKQFAAIWKNLQIHCKVLQNSRSRETEIVPNQMLFCSKSSPNC